MINNWERFLPGFVRKQFDKYENLKKITENIGWLFINRILGLVIGVFTGVWLARYLGPEKLGILNYAITFTGLFGVITSLGLDSIIVRDIVKKPEEKDLILGTSFILKLIAGIFVFILCVTIIILLKTNNTLLIVLVGINAISYIFHSFNLIDFYFQSQVMSKYVVYAYNLSTLIGTIALLILILLGGSLIAIAALTTINVFITSLFLIIAYQYKKNSIFKWCYSYAMAKRLLKEAFPLIFVGIATTIYMKIDKIMIGDMINDRALGIYSVAVQISEMWYFIPLAIVSTVFPLLVETKKKSEEIYNIRFQKLYELLAFISIIVSLLAVFFSYYAIGFLFGKKFIEAASLLTINIWAGIFISVRIANNVWITTEGLQKYSLYTTLIGCTMNIFLNFLLIPLYASTGAAIATLISHFVSTFSVILFKKTRISFFMMAKAFLFLNLFRNNIRQKNR